MVNEVIPDSLVRFRIGVAPGLATSGASCRSTTTTPAIIYDPPHDTDAKTPCGWLDFISDTYGANLTYEGIPHWRTVPDDYEGQWDADGCDVGRSPW